MTGGLPDDEQFGKHAELFRLFLARRAEIVGRIQDLLNAQRKPLQYLQDGRMLSHHFEECCFALPALSSGQVELRGRLQEAHWSSGFRPREMPGLHNDLVEPGQMLVRAFHLWRQTRWPGRNGRLRFAQTLFNLYVLRNLELLVMRLWDVGSDRASARLLEVQGLLDELWGNAPADQPVLVRDARWLLPLAQSPTTDDLSPYFRVLERIARTHSEADRLEIHKAAVQMAGGHLRSQLRHYLTGRHAALDEPALTLSSRNSNALDFAMLVQGLVPLLKAYDAACGSGDSRQRHDLAGAILQGVSADPDLFVNRLDLLGAYTMIEPLFVTGPGEEPVRYTPMGLRHVGLLQDYAGLMSHRAKSLHEDCPAFRPADGTYSPYGLIYGFSSNLTEHIALKTLGTDVVTGFSLEDVFSPGGADKLDWVNGWRKLPHIDAEVQRLFAYPQRFAEDIFARIETALRARVAASEAGNVVHTGRLFILKADAPEGSAASQIPALPVPFVGSSDTELVAAGKARSYDQTRLLHDRQEGTFAVSYETPGGWVAVTKDFLTDLLGAGHDVKVSGLPAAAAEVLRLMCPGLVSAVH